jgi:hypothetical protein
MITDISEELAVPHSVLEEILHTSAKTIEVAYPSETSVCIYQTAERQVIEDSILQIMCHFSTLEIACYPVTKMCKTIFYFP